MDGWFWVELAATQSFDLSQTTFVPGDVLTCTASATDNDGEMVEAGSQCDWQYSANRINIAIAPTPTVGVQVGCTATIFDPDNQALTTSYSWFNDSTSQSAGNFASIILTGALVSQGDSIRCG